MNQSDMAAKSVQQWLALYRVDKVLTHSNYLIRHVNTNYTQVVHRIRLKRVTLQHPVKDLTEIDEKNLNPSRT